MRNHLIATVAALALFTAPSLAQTTGSTTTPGSPALPPPAAPAPGSPAAAAAARTPAPNPLTMEDVSKISGTTVFDTEGKKIGDVSTALMDPQSKTIDRLVVSAGGVLGIGGHKVAMPVDQFSWDSDKGGFKLAKSQDELKAMPEWKSASDTAAASPASPSPSSGSSAPSPGGLAAPGTAPKPAVKP